MTCQIDQPQPPTGRFGWAGPRGPEAEHRADTFVPHAFPERLVDLGEIRMNYGHAGRSSSPALLLIPGQTESWWGYEAAMTLLADRFEIFAVDLRGQGRSTWTPGRYTLDNMGNDLVRFIDTVIGRPTVVSGLSSGGVLSAWLAAYAKPGQVRGALLEDPPLFASELVPAYGPSIRQAAGPMFDALATFLGAQWRIADWAGLTRHLAEHGTEGQRAILQGSPVPPQNLLEYDPEWGAAFWSGSVGAGCGHERLLASVTVPVLITHHFRRLDPASGHLIGALADIQAEQARRLIQDVAGQPCDYRSFPRSHHFLHGTEPEVFAETVAQWAGTLDPALGRTDQAPDRKG